MHDVELRGEETPKTGWLWNGVAAAAAGNKAASESTESFIRSG